MRLVIAVDDSEQASKVVEALTPWIRGVQPEQVHLISIVDMSQVHEARRGDEPDFEPTPAYGSRPAPQQPPPQPAETHGQALERAHTERVEFLDDLARDHMSGIEVQVQVISDDGTADAIAAYGLEVHADLIAVGSHGRSGVSRALMGSIAERVVRRSEVPVVVVRDGMHTWEAGSA